MRAVLLMLLALLASPAIGQDWDRYANSRFGYAIDIPPGFAGNGESSNGDGQGFRADGQAVDMWVWGGQLPGGFEDEVAGAMRGAEADGWNITGQTTTGQWAHYGAVQSGRVLYQRMILLCDRASYAAVRLEYSVTDVGRMGPVTQRLESSLRSAAC